MSSFKKIKLPKVLLSAYACEPGKGSESYVGWSWVTHLSSSNDLTVLTRANNREVIEAHLKKYPDAIHENVNFLYYDLPKPFLWAKTHGLISVRLYYTLWQIMIALKYAPYARAVDIVHHITFNTFVLPGLWWHDGPRVILGPLGGGAIVSKDYLPLFLKGRWVQNLRTWCVQHWYYLPWIRKSLDRADKIIAANQDTYQLLAGQYDHKLEIHLETGIGSENLTANVVTKHIDTDVLKFSLIGSIESRKGWKIALDAMQQFIESDKEAHLDIIGDGPEKEELRAYVEVIGIEPFVTIHGKLSHEETKRMLRSSDVLLFTSVRDTSGNVVIEAMRESKPVICIKHQGVAEITTDETAIRISAGDIESTVTLFAEGMLKLAEDKAYRLNMGRNGYQRITTMHNWETKSDYMNGLYTDLLQDDRVTEIFSPTGRKKILLSAYACEPNRGSEPEVGWKWAELLSREYDVTVLTRSNNQDIIEGYLKSRPNVMRGVRFEYHDLSEKFIDYKKKCNAFEWYYVCWQRSARAKILNLIKDHKIDIIHHVTYASFRYNPFLGNMPIPVVWGPVGGADTASVSLMASEFKLSQVTKELIRNVLTTLSSAILPLIDPTRTSGGYVIASTPRTAELINKKGIKCSVLPTIGKDKDPDTLVRPENHGVLKFMMVGRLHYLKGIHYALRAFAHANISNSTLNIYGEGSELKYLKQLAQELDIYERVHFKGHIARDKLLDEYHNHDVLIVSSLYESGGFTVLEGYDALLGAIVTDVGGLGLSVNEKCGFKIKPKNAKYFIENISAAMQLYDNDRSLILKHGKYGKERINSLYSWEKKLETMRSVYHKICP